VGEKLLHVEVERASSRSVFSGFLNARIIYLFLAFAGLVFVHFFGSGNIRFIFLIFNFVVGGLIFNVEMSISHLLTLFRFDYPSFDNTIHFILITGVLVLSVLFGPVYCAHMCPFGAGQEILGRISHFRIAAGEKVEKAGRFIKYGFLASVAVCVFHPSQENLFSSDPLQNAFSYRFDFVSGLMILLIAVFSLFFFRFFCRTLCPVGAFLNIFNKLRISWLCRPERNYSNCDLGARHSLDIDCLQCNRCVNDHNINVGGASAPNI
jgi:polyferredoxin